MRWTGKSSSISLAVAIALTYAAATARGLVRPEGIMQSLRTVSWDMTLYASNFDEPLLGSLLEVVSYPRA